MPILERLRYVTEADLVYCRPVDQSTSDDQSPRLPVNGAVWCYEPDRGLVTQRN